MATAFSDFSSYLGSSGGPSWQTGFSTGKPLFNQGSGAGGGSSMLPGVAMGLGMLGQGLFGMIGANRQADTMANVANAQMAAQANAIQNAREIQKGNLGMGMFNTVFGATTAPDLEFGRQLAAKRAEFAEFLPKQAGLEREQARWATSFALSPEARELSRRERMGRLQETIAGYQAQPTGMFGPIRRINIEALAG